MSYLPAGGINEQLDVFMKILSYSDIKQSTLHKAFELSKKIFPRDYRKAVWNSTQTGVTQSPQQQVVWHVKTSFLCIHATLFLLSWLGLIKKPKSNTNLLFGLDYTNAIHMPGWLLAFCFDIWARTIKRWRPNHNFY